ncbi:Hsp33 family molecular chaperone HslO [Comamonas flocculans]|uniref:Hsp33 family molecular chaperone HslO n=1 Tax=Comamonas flocculans TaxID=2597701 RepID=A0A5B8RYJ4_9BURK|nr:Hsp33 family molecular chaperone HslO [Comamonas flocculans]QEA13768.1 Hsp33 family molecular chaperone HslO [Comamonas flocculans]
MSELQRFLFDGLPVRGAIVRLDDAWRELLARRAANTETGAYPAAVARLLGEMLAGAVLMHAHVKYDGTLILQIAGDGPVRLAVAQVDSSLQLRATASVTAPVAEDAPLAELVNGGGAGRCAITLDPRQRTPGQQPYQGIVALADDAGQAFADLGQGLQHYMQRSEQLPTVLVLAANQEVAAGLLVQRMPLSGEGNLGEGELPPDLDFERIATLAASLSREELLTLAPAEVLRRLFWQERLMGFAPLTGAEGPRFACTCSRERVAEMLRGLGEDEVSSIVQERGEVEVGCEYCGRQYRFDAIDAQQLFTAAGKQPPPPSRVQ